MSKDICDRVKYYGGGGQGLYSYLFPLDHVCPPKGGHSLTSSRRNYNVYLRFNSKYTTWLNIPWPVPWFGSNFWVLQPSEVIAVLAQLYFCAHSIVMLRSTVSKRRKDLTRGPELAFLSATVDCLDLMMLLFFTAPEAVGTPGLEIWERSEKIMGKHIYYSDQVLVCFYCW